MQVMTTDNCYVKNHLKAFEVQFTSYSEWSMTINTRDETNEIGTWHTDSDKWLIIWLAKQVSHKIRIIPEVFRDVLFTVMCSIYFIKGTGTKKISNPLRRALGNQYKLKSTQLHTVSRLKKETLLTITNG